MVVCVALALPAGASAAPACGDTITQSAVLESDLTCGPEGGIVIGAPGITLDLAGHTINTSFTAILNEGHDNVTIKNGHVGSDGAGIVLNGVSGNLIRDVDLGGLYTGIVLSGSSGNRIVSNQLVSVSMNIGSGSNDNVIRGNTVLSFEGVVAIRNSSRNRLIDNLVSTVDETAILLDAADHTVLRDNDITAVNGIGVDLQQAHDNRLVENDIHGKPNGAQPIDVFGVRLTGSHRNELRRNRFLDNTTAVQLVSGWANNLRDNDAILGDGDAYLIEPGAVGTKLLGNLALGMGGDGFDVRAWSTQLGDNDAFYNEGHGINAVPGVTDLGGNQAFRNDTTPECVNVACS
jgi:parallel beta-helix repeat protein